jgi:hypothetical protein
MSGSLGPGRREALLALGADGVLTKPDPVAELPEVLAWLRGGHADGLATHKELESVRRCRESPWSEWTVTQPSAWRAALALAQDPEWRPLGALVGSLLREVFGKPFRPVAVEPAWLTAEVRSLAEAAYKERLPDATLDSARLAVLADALEEVGCFALDLLTGRR